MPRGDFLLSTQRTSPRRGDCTPVASTQRKRQGGSRSPSLHQPPACAWKVAVLPFTLETGRHAKMKTDYHRLQLEKRAFFYTSFVLHISPAGRKSCFPTATAMLSALGASGFYAATLTRCASSLRDLRLVAAGAADIWSFAALPEPAVGAGAAVRNTCHCCLASKGRPGSRSIERCTAVYRGKPWGGFSVLPQQGVHKRNTPHLRLLA